MVRTYTKLLAAVGGDATAAGVELFAAKPGVVTVLRDILFYGVSVAPQLMVLTYVMPGLVIHGLLIAEMAPRVTMHLDLRQVIPEGAIVKLDVYHELGWSITLTGYELTDSS